MSKYLDDNGLLYFWGKIKNHVTSSLTSKQDTINDLSTIRSGAEKGATAIQTETDPVFGASAAAGIQSSDITNWNNKTSNIGTITEIKMNGTNNTPNSSGIVDIGTVITEHQDISGKVDKTVTVNGHALNANITVTKSDVSLGNVTNDALVKRTEMGTANGVATLDGNGKVPSSQLPSYVDDVIEVYGVTNSTPLTSSWLSDTDGGSAISPEAGKIYVLMQNYTSGNTVYYANSQFRWGGSAYVPMYDGGVTFITNSEIDTIVTN